MKNRTIWSIFLATMLAFGATAEEAGFLTDYSLLSESHPTVAQSGQLIGRGYAVDDVDSRLAKYDGVMVDQPEFFLSPKSKYKGIKPDDAKMIADEMGRALIRRVERGGFNVVEEAGPSIIYMRTALTHMRLAKKKRGIMSFTPVGAVAHGIGNATKGFLEKVDVVEMTFELELLDSTSGEVLAALTLTRPGDRREKRYSWEGVESVMQTLGERIRCRFANSRAEAADRQDCSQILVTIDDVREQQKAEG